MKTDSKIALTNEISSSDKTSQRFQPIVVDVDGSITEQTEFIKGFNPITLPFRKMQQELRYYSSFETLNLVRQRFLLEAGSIEGKVVFYGSGDFHNLAYVWLGLIKEPITIIHFDNHTDLYKNFTGVHAGNWAINASKLPNVKKLIQLGVDGDLDVNASKFLTNTVLPIGPFMNELSMLKNGRHEIYPTAMQHSTMFGQFSAENPSVVFTKQLFTTSAEWKNIRRFGIENIMKTF